MGSPAEASTLARVRLDRLLERARAGITVLVTGPAGAGKTTAVADWLNRCGAQATWVSLDVTHGTEARLVDALRASARIDVDPSSTLAQAARVLHGRVLVLDDFHALQGSESEREVGRLIADADAHARLVLVSRELPGFDLSRPRVGGRLVEVGADDLRFRSWEAEELFRDVYGERLPPAQLAELTRRTEGWAAGLQLFHLATRGKAAAERGRVLSAIVGRSRYVREYLAANVLASLSPELRRFLVETSVLGTLTGLLCDALVGGSGSSATLEELERRGVFTVRDESTGVWRYHEVLRSHLQLVLAEEDGDAAVRERHRRAGRLLEDAGATVDALHAYARAGDAEATGRLLRARGEDVAGAAGSWLDSLPAALRDSDPWLLLADARRHATAGRWRHALDLYGRARAQFGASGPEEVCASEQRSLARWLEPAVAPPDDAMGYVRAATRGNPLVQLRRAATSPRPDGIVAGAAIALLSGFVDGALVLANAARGHPHAEAATTAVADAISGFARVLGGSADVDELERAAESCHRTGLEWIATCLHVARMTVSGHGTSEVLEVRRRFVEEGNPWAAGIVAVLAAWGSLQGPWPPGPAVSAAVADAAAAFRRVDAAVAHGWALALGAALAVLQDDPSASRLAEVAAAHLRRTDAAGPSAIVSAVLARTDVTRRAAHAARAVGLAEGLGVALPPLLHTDAQDAAGGRACDATIREHRTAVSRFGVDVTAAGTATPVPGRTISTVAVRCFGVFRIVVDGHRVDLSGLRPRARSLLHLVAVHAGRDVHREALVEALWPSLDPSRGLRNLHVALSSVRGVLAQHGARGLLARDAESYRLELPAGADVDVRTVERAIEAVRSAARRGDVVAARDACDAALAAHAGPLLPAEGPAEWVVPLRRRFENAVLDAAQTTADLLLAAGDPRAASDIARRALRVDELRDSLWDVLVAALDASGQRREAAHARVQRAAVVEDPHAAV